IDLLVLSIEDVAGDEALLAHYAAACPLVVATRGVCGATLYRQGQSVQIGAYSANEQDPTGAGDVFAATMLILLYETGDALRAAAGASLAAALAVEGPGLGALGGVGSSDG
ncbi:MAG: ribokinase, partial [Candidatus Viridilinea halotolerans]